MKQQSIIESINKCKVEGNVLYLPPFENGPLPNYPDVKSTLVKAGGKYQKNKFVFPTDAQPIIDRICGGEKINIKKDFQFFPTSEKLANQLVEYANPQYHNTILEPSAGQGAIIKAIIDYVGSNSVMVDYCELMDLNRSILEKIPQTREVGIDFLEFAKSTDLKYDVIIANPPFSKNQDIEHFKAMHGLLREHGTLVSVMSNHWRQGGNTKEKNFRSWLSKLNFSIVEIEEGEFKESGTMIASCVVIIQPPF